MKGMRSHGRCSSKQHRTTTEARAGRLVFLVIPIDDTGAERLFFYAKKGEICVGRGFAIDREMLPYDAFVPDEAWLMPLEEGDDEDGDQRTETDSDGNQGAGGESGKEKTE